MVALMPDSEKVTMHELKCWPPYFEHVLLGRKPFECRSTEDRIFAVGDTLLLREYDSSLEYREPETGGYTGRACERTITYVLGNGDYGIQRGFVVMGLAAVLASEGAGEHAECSLTTDEARELYALWRCHGMRPPEIDENHPAHTGPMKLGLIQLRAEGRPTQHPVDEDRFEEAVQAVIRVRFSSGEWADYAGERRHRETAKIRDELRAALPYTSDPSVDAEEGSMLLVTRLKERVLRTPEPTPKQEKLMEEFGDEMPTWAQLAFVQSENERMREEVRKAIAESNDA
jgi:hypothetical protein